MSATLTDQKRTTSKAAPPRMPSARRVQQPSRKGKMRATSTPAVAKPRTVERADLDAALLAQRKASAEKGPVQMVIEDIAQAGNEVIDFGADTISDLASFAGGAVGATATLAATTVAGGARLTEDVVQGVDDATFDILDDQMMVKTTSASRSRGRAPASKRAASRSGPTVTTMATRRDNSVSGAVKFFSSKLPAMSHNATAAIDHGDALSVTFSPEDVRGAIDFFHRDRGVNTDQETAGSHLLDRAYVHKFEASVRSADGLSTAVVLLDAHQTDSPGVRLSRRAVLHKITGGASVQSLVSSHLPVEVSIKNVASPDKVEHFASDKMTPASVRAASDIREDVYGSSNSVNVAYSSPIGLAAFLDNNVDSEIRGDRITFPKSSLDPIVAGVVAGLRKRSNYVDLSKGLTVTVSRPSSDAQSRPIQVTLYVSIEVVVVGDYGK